MPYRIHLLSDLERENFPAYKCYLFPNLWLNPLAPGRLVASAAFVPIAA